MGINFSSVSSCNPTYLQHSHTSIPATWLLVSPILYHANHKALQCNYDAFLLCIVPTQYDPVPHATTKFDTLRHSLTYYSTLRTFQQIMTDFAHTLIHSNKSTYCDTAYTSDVGSWYPLAVLAPPKCSSPGTPVGVGANLGSRHSAHTLAIGVPIGTARRSPI